MFGRRHKIYSCQSKKYFQQLEFGLLKQMPYEAECNKTRLVRPRNPMIRGSLDILCSMTVTNTKRAQII
jgi:hypothetical protein